MTTPEGQKPGSEGSVPDEAIESAPPPSPEEAAAEQAQAEGKSTAEGEPSPPVDTAAGGEGKAAKPQGPAPAPRGDKPTREAPAGDEAAKAAATPGAEKAAAAKTAAPERPARPAREAEPKEAPRNPPPPGSINEVLASILPAVRMEAYMVPELTGEAVAIEVGRDDLTAVIAAARDDERLKLHYLRSLTGVDWQDEGLEVVYHLWSFEKRHNLVVKTRVPADDAKVPSLTSLFPAADWHERETRDMFGIDFEGHPNLVPLLLPEDMTDHFPLRKDNPLQEIEEWQGELLREGAGDEGEEE
jgi:NADH-quinone oxidoreductase subunit C